MKKYPAVTKFFRALAFSRFSAPALAPALLLAFASIAAHGAELRASAVAAGGAHTCALGVAGEVMCWGHNANSQLGEGSLIPQRESPTLVKGLPSGIKALALGDRHSCALTEDGKVLCWGSHGSGQLGQADGFRKNFEAVEVQGLPMAVRAVSAGGEHNCAVTIAGGAVCWGRNGEGQLGDTTGGQRNLPVSVANLSANVAAVAAGGYHSCALTTAGAVLCWGSNAGGILGVGSTQPNHTAPVPVPGLESGVTAISAGSTHSCALLEGGTVKCWGNNKSGQLGDGGTGAHVGAVEVRGLGPGVAALSVGGEKTCVLDGTGNTVCWGSNYYYPGMQISPTPLAGLASGVSSIDVGSGHICAVVQGGAVKCLGSNLYNQAGNICAGACPSARGLTHFAEPPRTVVSLGNGGACSIAASGRISCPDSMKDHKTLSMFDGSARAKSAKFLGFGTNHTCVLTEGGAVNCWGLNLKGPFGHPAPGLLGNPAAGNSSETPVEPLGLGRGVAALAVEDGRTCALTEAGAVKCWGYAFTSQTTCQKLNCTYPPAIPIPTDVPGMTTGVSAIAMNSSSVYALTANGTVLCHGHRCPTGGAVRVAATAVTVDGLSGVTAIVARAKLACALGATVKCWRAEDRDGIISFLPSDALFDTLPTEVVGLAHQPVAIASGANHACALLAGGKVQCWGGNSDGALGDNTTISRPNAVEVLGLAGPATAIFATSGNTCALLAAGGAQCWGANGSGQLGFHSDLITTPNTVSSPSATCSASAAPLVLKVGEASTLSATCSPDTKRILWFEEGREDIAFMPGKAVKPVFTTTYVARGVNDDGVGPTRATVTVTVTDSAQFKDHRRYYSIGKTPSGIHVIGGQYDKSSQTFPALKRLRFYESRGFYGGTTLRLVALDIDGVPGQVQRLYRAALPPKSMETPDTDISSWWPSEAGSFLHNKYDGITAIETYGWTLERVAQSFLYLPEFERRYGVMDDRQFVERIHMNTLYRAPSAETVAFYVDGLASGAFTRARVLMGFAENPGNPMLATVTNLEEVAY